MEKKKNELKESCEQHGFEWSEVDLLMRFWCQISKSRIHDDLINEWIGDDEKIMVDESSSVQPASSNISSNVGIGPQQPSIAEDNERMLEEADPSPPGNNITDGVVFVQSSSSSTAKEDKKEVDDEKMIVDYDESSSLQTLINPEASFSSTSAEAFLPATSGSSAETALLVTSSSSAESSLLATSSSSAEIALPATSSSSASGGNEDKFFYFR